MGIQVYSYRKQLAAWAERNRRIMALLGQGVSQSEIARRYGLTRARVSQIVKSATRLTIAETSS